VKLSKNEIQFSEKRKDGPRKEANLSFSASDPRLDVVEGQMTCSQSTYAPEAVKSG